MTEEPIEITTECPRGRTALRIGQVFLGTLALLTAAANVLIWIYPPQKASHGDLIDLNVFCLILITALLFPLFQTKRGTWLIDSCGIAFTELHGRTTALRWDEIELIQWQPQCAGFRSSSIKMFVTWSHCDEAGAARAKQFVEARLRHDFDLTIRQSQRAFKRGFWPFAKWFAKIFTVSLGLTAVCMSGVLFAALWAPQSDAAWAIGTILVFSPWLLLISTVIRERRLNPIWRPKRERAGVNDD